MCFRIANRYNSYVNDIFFNLFESMVYCIINLKIKFDEISDQNFELFLNEIKILSHILMKFNIELSLTLKQILYLFDFVEVKEIFNKNGIELKKNLNAYLDLLKEENEKYLIPEYINSNSFNSLKVKNEPIDEEFNLLKEKLSQLKEYPDLIVKLLNNKIRVSKKEEYRLKLLKIICSDHRFIIKSKNIFYIILNRFKIKPENKNDDIIIKKKKMKWKKKKKKHF